MSLFQRESYLEEEDEEEEEEQEQQQEQLLGMEIEEDAMPEVSRDIFKGKVYLSFIEITLDEKWC